MHLLHPFRSSLAKFGLAATSDLVSAADKPERVSFDLRPDLAPTSDFLKIFLRTFVKEFPRCELPIAVSRSSIRLLARKLDGGGGIYAPPPPTEEGWRLRRIKGV